MGADPCWTSSLYTLQENVRRILWPSNYDIFSNESKNLLYFHFLTYLFQYNRQYFIGTNAITITGKGPTIQFINMMWCLSTYKDYIMSYNMCLQINLQWRSDYAFGLIKVHHFNQNYWFSCIVSFLINTHTNRNYSTFFLISYNSEIYSVQSLRTCGTFVLNNTLDLMNLL